MSSGNDVSSLPRRRNGKQRACEPCRKAKIACDHSLPICLRCRRKGLSSKCCYLDAPMTRRAAPPQNSVDTTSAPPVRVETAVEQQQSLPSPDISRPSLTRDPQTAASKPAGFFGPTAFSAVFSENQENFENDLHVVNPTDIPPNNGFSYESIQPQTFLMLGGAGHPGSARVVLGAKVLRQLPDERTFQFLINYYRERMSECILHKPSVLFCANSLWKTFGEVLAEPRRPGKLEEVSALLCKNAETALEDYDDYEKYLESFSGMNMRWEIVGQVFCVLTTALLSLSERDPFFISQDGLRSNRKYFASEMKDAVQACITLSNYMDLMNVPMVALLAKNMILSTIIHGDTSLIAWRQLGDLVSAATALGLHRDAEIDRPISVASEYRRRIFGVVFRIDKSTSLLTGRPPALSYQYTRFNPPTALSDEAVMQGGLELENAIAGLDANGWNTDGIPHPSTRNRISVSMAIILDQILEFSLGNPVHSSQERCKELLNKTEELYSSFPYFLRLNKGDMALSTISDQHIFCKLIMRLEYLELTLLLERLAAKSGMGNDQSMIDRAMEMLELTVLVWIQRDRFMQHHHDFDWMLMCYGVPASGVICVHLLNQMRQSIPEREQPLRYRRSEMVQNLSLLVGFLDWIRPSAGNYQLCTRMKKIIKQILDKILSPPPLQPAPVTTPTSDTSPDAGGDVFNANLFQAGAYNGLDDLDWLNSVDWSRGPWIDLAGLT
ncbi:hypothetical protein F5884DRAFT_822734 [Xylogone sp. PMI_703]|nr:hypothetical protein F5884DRAFT_822734 [Xylogone sp. PMI_703]